MQIRRAAVLGAGTMGAQIAALLADRGIACDLLDLASEGDKSRLAVQAKERLPALKPPAFESPNALDLIEPGNFDDDLPRIRQADWVIEAVAEDIEVKRRLWARAARYIDRDAIASTNTSGIPIASIGEALPPALRRRFLGTHFYNPPAHMRLLELIPSMETDPDVAAAMSGFAEDVLGKSVVLARDVPNFIGNRIGIYSLLAAIRAAEEFGLGPVAIDSITGPPMGRPRSATFRTLDLIGLDVVSKICANMHAPGVPDWELQAFDVPEIVRSLTHRGWTGAKAGQGFYKMTREGATRTILALDFDTLEYGQSGKLDSVTVTAANEIEEPSARLRTLLSGSDPGGRFGWSVLSRTLAYAARMVGTVADDIVSIDRTMRWGWAWELGPFEAWDALGVRKTAEGMMKDGLDIPKWVTDLAAAGGSFYLKEPDGVRQVTRSGTYEPIS